MDPHHGEGTLNLQVEIEGVVVRYYFLFLYFLVLLLSLLLMLLAPLASSLLWLILHIDLDLPCFLLLLQLLTLGHVDCFFLLLLGSSLLPLLSLMLNLGKIACQILTVRYFILVWVGLSLSPQLSIFFPLLSPLLILNQPILLPLHPLNMLVLPVLHLILVLLLEILLLRLLLLLVDRLDLVPHFLDFVLQRFYLFVVLGLLGLLSLPLIVHGVQSLVVLVKLRPDVSSDLAQSSLLCEQFVLLGLENVEPLGIGHTLLKELFLLDHLAFLLRRD